MGLRHIVIAGSFSVCCGAAYAQGQTVEQVAQAVATQHNANAKSFLDQMTAATSAKAIGKNVRLEYVLRVKKGLSSAKLREFSEETQREVVPGACRMNANNEAFKRGLYYTFVYMNTYGEKLAEFRVDKAVCGNLK